MATSNIEIEADVWTPIAAGPTTVYLTGSDDFEYCTTAGLPPDPQVIRIGHAWPERTLLPATLLAGETLYVRRSLRKMTLARD